MIKTITGYLTKPMTALLGLAGVIASLAYAILSIKKSGKNEAETDMSNTVTAQRAKAEAQDVELLKKQRRRSTDHENNIRNNSASPFIDD